MAMTTISIRVINKSMHGPGLRLGAVADVIPIDRSRRRSAPGYLRGLVLPIVRRGDPLHPTNVEVEPGAYLIRATLPSGETLTKEIDVAESPLTVDLMAWESPHEWLGKSQVLGVISELRRLAKIRSRLGVVPVARPQDVSASWLETVNSGDRLNDWLNAEEVTRDKEPRLLFGGLIAGGKLKSAFADDQFEKFLVVNRNSLGPTDQPSARLEKLLGRIEDPNAGTRYYLAVEDDDGPRGLAVLPLPWHSRSEGDVPIEVLLCEPAAGSSFAEGPAQPVISVDDPDVAALLGYLGRYDLPAAEAILSRAVQWLYEKMMNPFAAAAGGYILLAADGSREIPAEQWKLWIHNLAERFRWLPDGAIQLAWLKLSTVIADVRLGPTRAEETDAVVSDAAKLLLRGLGAGVPVFSVGVRLLVDGLTVVTDHQEYRGKEYRGKVGTQEKMVTARALTLARWLSRRTDPTQPFTAIRI